MGLRTLTPDEPTVSVFVKVPSPHDLHRSYYDPKRVQVDLEECDNPAAMPKYYRVFCCLESCLPSPSCIQSKTRKELNELPSSILQKEGGTEQDDGGNEEKEDEHRKTWKMKQALTGKTDLACGINEKSHDVPSNEVLAQALTKQNVDCVLCCRCSPCERSRPADS